MNVEELLRQDLHRVADPLPTPAPPAIEALTHAASVRQTRSRRRALVVLGAAAAAVLAIALIGTKLGDEGASPSPMPQPNELKTGAPPAIPYINAVGQLRIDGKDVPGDWGDVTTVGDATVVLRAGATRLYGSVLFLDGERTPLLDDSQGQAALSPRGIKLAWIERKPGDVRPALVLYDLEAGQELGRTDLDPSTVSADPDNEGNVRVVAVTDEGTVTYGGITDWATWKPGGDPVHTTPPQWMNAVWAGFDPTIERVWMGPDGVTGAWLSGRHGEIENVYDGNAQLQTDGLSIQRRDEPSSRFTIPMPPDVFARQLAWESPTTVLVLTFMDANEGDPRTLRCDIVKKNCEVAPTP